MGPDTAPDHPTMVPSAPESGRYDPAMAYSPAIVRPRARLK